MLGLDYVCWANHFNAFEALAKHGIFSFSDRQASQDHVMCASFFTLYGLFLTFSFSFLTFIYTYGLIIFT
jgi:hypothetical protein